MKPPLASPDDIEQQFYDAMQRADIDAMMAVWSDDDDIVCIHPGGIRISGPVAIRASFAAIFEHGAIAASPERVRRVHTDSCAMHSVLERVQVRTAEGTRVAWAIATNVYVKTPMGWRMVAHHASPGTAADEQETSEPPSTLH